MYIDNLAFLDSAGVTLLPGGVDMLNMEPYTIGEAAINTTLVTEYGMIGWGGDNAYLNGISIVANPIPSTSELLTGNWKCTRLSVSSEAGVRESEVFSTTDVTPPGINADMFLNIAANNSGHMTRIYNTAILNETDTFDDDALFGSGVDRKPDDYTTILDGPTYRATPVSTNGSTEITLNGTTMNPAYLVYYAVSNNSINYGVPDESMNDRTYQIIELTDTTMTLSIGFETSTGVQNYWNATYNKDSTSYPLYLRILAFESYAELLADGVTPAEIRALGLSISQLNDMGANFKELEYLDIQELISSGVSIGTLVLYFTLAELKAEFTLADLKQEFTLAELIEVGFTLAELKLEFALAELKLEFALAELLAEFELAELKAESYKLTSEIVGESDSSYGYVEANTDGTTYVIANNGLRRIEVYHKVGTQWSLKGTPISYLSEESNGYGVDINSDGTIISFGEIYAPQGGYMSVYQYSDNLQDWEQLGSTIRALPPDTTGEGFGYRTRLSYNGLIVAGSSPFQSSSNLELVVVYKYSDVSHEWEQLGQTILSEDPDNFGYGQNDHGYSLDISADGLTLVIGARLAEAQLGNARIYAYNEDSSLWEQKGDTIGSFNQKLSPGAPLSAEHLSMDASGLTIAIADRYDAGSAGVTRIFQYDDVSSTWTQLGQDINGEAAGDRSGWFGIKLSADGSTVAIGAPFNDGNGTNSGHIRVYQNESGTWTQISQDIDGAKADDLFGATMTMSASGTTLFAVNSSNAGTLVNIYDRTPLFTLAELKLEFTLAELKLEFELAELKLEFELAELKLEFELADFKAAGYTVAELKAGGFTLAELKELFTLRELYDAGFTIAELLALGGDINFVQLGQDIDGEAAYDYSVAVSTSADGSIVAFGAGRNDGNGRYSGHVRVYKNESGTWTQIGQDIDGEAADDRSGHSLSVSADGSIVAIGARYNDGNGSNSGHVRVYKNESGTWTQIGQDIDGEGAGDNSGWSVSLSNDGSIVAIGAIYNDGNGFNSGHVRVYKNESGTWTQIGQDIDGEAEFDYSGRSVSLSADGSIVAIGANGNNNANGSSSGHVRVYKNESGTWTQIGQDIDGEAEFDYSGRSVSLSADGSIVAIGAIYNDGVNGTDSGHVRVYQNVSGTWTQIGQDIDGEAEYDYSGYSVSLSNDGSIVAIGAYSNDGNGSLSGHVRVYQNESGTWTQIGQDIDGEAAGDQSGTSVSLSADGSIVAIGARYNAGVNGSYSGHVRVYQKVVIGVTIADLIAAGFTAADFKAAGYTLAELIAAGFTLAELKLEFELAELKLEFELAELKLEFELAELKLEFELAELIAGGFTLAELKLEFELAELMLLELFVLADFKAAGFTLAELKAGGFTLAELKELFTLRELYDTGFTIADLLALGGDINFVQLGQDIDGEAAYDYSGGSVSLSANGSIVAIGANGSDGNGTLSGHVRVYQNVSGTWTQIGEDIDGEAIYDWSGYSVSLSADGSIVAIGAIGNAGDGSYSGHVRVYQNESGTWTQIGQDIDGEAANDRSGNTVSLSADGSIVAIGAPYNDGNGNDSGHVRVYKNKSGIWTPIGQGIFQDIDGEAAGDQSGVSVSLSADGSIVAIGAYYNDGNGNNSGHVRVYQYRIVPINVGPGSTIYTEVWTQIGQDIDGEAAGDWSGVSVSLSNDGSIVAIGANYNNANGLNSGHVRVYQNESGTWTQIGQDIDGEAEFDYSGRSVSLSADGSIVAIGAYRNDGNGTDSGHVRVYQNESGTWTQIGQDIDGEAAGDESGATVSLSADGSIVAIGAYGNDGNGTNSGHVRVYQKVDTTITIAVLIAAGFTLAELKLEFELAELKLEFELAELKLEFELAELKLEFELAELIAGGFTLAELKLEFELAELMLLELFVLADFKAAGYTVAELKAGGFTIVELLAVGFTDLEIARGGFTATQMFEADINPLVFKNDVPTSEFRDFGYTCKIARLVYPIANVVSAYTSIELKDAGVNIETLVNYKKPLADIKTAYSDITTTYTPVQLKPIYTIREMSSIYSITELTDAFTLLQMNNEYSLPELLELGAYDFEQMDLDFTFPELRGKFTLRELNTVFSLVKLHTELSFKVLNGEFTLRELNKSFTLKELHTEFTLARINESFTLVEMNAEFTLKELREAFSYNQLRNEFTALELAEGNVYD
jgi:hypothetical protein